MQQVLVYSDSLSWGIVPTTRKRLPFDADQHERLGRELAAFVSGLPDLSTPTQR